MLAYTYAERGKFELREKPKPELIHKQDAVVRVTLSSICTSDLHIKHGSVPRAVPGITLGHEMVGVVESVGPDVTAVKPGDRVAVNVETYCGTCFFCRHGWVNNCTDPNGGWALGCRIDGGCPTPTRPSAGFRTGCPTGRPCLLGTSWPPGSGRPASQRSDRRTRCSFWERDPPGSAPCCASW